MGPRDFAWSLVHIVQIGLGRFDTFMDCGVPWMQTLLEASSRQSFPSLRGIGVDPVEEAAVGFSAAAARYEGVSVLKVAIGDTCGTDFLICLRPDAQMLVKGKARVALQE